MLDRIVNMIARGGRLSDEQYKGNPVFVVNLAHPDVPSIPDAEFAVTCATRISVRRLSRSTRSIPAASMLATFLSWSQRLNRILENESKALR